MKRLAFLALLSSPLAAQQPAASWPAYVRTFDTYVAAESINVILAGLLAGLVLALTVVFVG